MKNLLTQWETEEENQKIGGGVLPIDRTSNGGVLFIDAKLAELEDDAECAFLPKLTELVKLLKLTELVKKPSNLTRTEKEKPIHSISYSLACFFEHIGRPCFRFAKGLTSGLTDGLAMSGAELRRGKVTVGFSR